MAKTDEYGGQGKHFRGGKPFDPGTDYGHRPVTNSAGIRTEGGKAPTQGGSWRGGAPFNPEAGGEKYGWRDGDGYAPPGRGIVTTFGGNRADDGGHQHGARPTDKR